MIKKVLFVSFTTLGAHCLDTNVSAVAQDSLALAAIFEANGYEVWLQDPYKLKKKQSSWPRKVMPSEVSAERFNEFDEMVLFCQNGHVKSLYGHSISPIAWNESMRNVIDAVHSFKGSTYIPVFDPKPVYRPPLMRDDVVIKGREVREGRGSQDYINKYADIVEKAAALWPDAEMAQALNIKKDKNIIANIFDHTHKYLQGEMRSTFNTNYSHDFIYTGYNLTPYRRKRLHKLLSKDVTLNLAKAGPVRMPNALGFKSITDKEISNIDNMNLLAQSRVQMVFGDVEHTFITPRFYQAAFYGSILICDSDYKAAARLLRQHGLGHHVVSCREDVINICNKSDAELSQMYFNQYNVLARVLLSDKPFTLNFDRSNNLVKKSSGLSPQTEMVMDAVPSKPYKQNRASIICNDASVMQFINNRVNIKSYKFIGTHRFRGDPATLYGDYKWPRKKIAVKGTTAVQHALRKEMSVLVK